MDAQQSPHDAGGQSAGTTAFRYDVFISYRHAEDDRRWACWLHKSLESWRTPRQLVRERGIRPRLQRVFRDEEELAATSDLSKEIDDALAGSRFLVVICSPSATESKWVNEEIERFAGLGRADQVLALLIDGTPADAFPVALLRMRPDAARQGRPGADVGEVEPLAADVRGDRGVRYERRLAKLRLLSTILGVRFDDLRRREREQRVRRLGLVMGGLFGLVALLTGLTAFAFHERGVAVSALMAEKRSAEEARAQADRSMRAAADVWVAQGLSRAESGDTATATLFYVRALESDSPDPVRQRIDRVRIAVSLWQSPRPLDVRESLPDGIDGEAAGKNLNWFSDDVNHRYEAVVADITTGQRRAIRLPLDGKFKAGGFIADGKRCYTVTEQGTTRVWDAESGNEVDSAFPWTVAGRPTAWSSDGRFVLAVDKDGKARSWELASGKPNSTAVTLNAAMTYLRFDPEHNLAVTSVGRQAVRVWDSFDCTHAISPVISLGELIQRAALTDGGRRLVTRVGADTVTITRPGTKELIWPTEPAVSQPSDDLTVRVWNAGYERRSITLPKTGSGTDNARDVAFSPDGRFMAIASDKSIYIRNVAAQTFSPVGFSHDTGASWLYQLRYSQDGRQLTLDNGETDETWDAATGRVITFPTTRPGVPDPSSGGDTTDGRWHVELKRLVGPGGQTINGVWHENIESPASVCISDRMGGTTVTLSPPANQRLLESALLSPDGTRLLLTSWDGFGTGSAATQIWDVATGKPVTPLMPHVGQINSAFFSPDGHLVVTRNYGLIRLWDADTGRRIGEPIECGTDTTRVRLSPDGRRLVAACMNGRVLAWDIAPDDRNTQDLERLAELVSLNRIDPSASVVPLTPAEREDRWKQCRMQYPRQFRAED